MARELVKLNQKYNNRAIIAITIMVVAVFALYAMDKTMSTLVVTEYKREQIKKWQADNQEKIRGYKKKWTLNNPEYRTGWQANHREHLNEYYRKWMVNHPEHRGRVSKYNKEWKVTNHFGSLERYEEAMLKYDGWCAFACDKEAKLVHHLDGKSVRNSPRQDVDNSLQNLLPLCRSCHTRLHHTKR